MANSDRQNPWAVLSMIWMVFLIMSIDKSAISVLAEPIRKDFELNDLEIGLLNGLAYALPFFVLGIPMGRLVDTLNRKWLLTGLLACWSLLTGLAALATSVVPFSLARAGVGAAEAGAPASMLSIITDTFDKDTRPRAIGIYYTAPTAGIMLGSALGGAVASLYDWRIALMAAAVPGLVLAAFLGRLLQNPPRGRFEPAASRARETNDMQSVGKFIADHVPFQLTLAGVSAGSIGLFGISAWVTPYMMRVHGLAIDKAGAVAATLGLAGALGSLLGGIVATHCCKGSNERLLLQCALVNFLGAPALILGAWGGSILSSVAGLSLFAFMTAMAFGPTFSLCLGWAPVAIRGTIAALVVMVPNLAGYGLGPALIGGLSDWGRSLGYPHPLRLAISLTAITILMNALFCHLARRRYMQAMRPEPA